jgi:hypothetical protein
MNHRETKVVTGKVRFSYANVWEPRSVNGGEEKYSVSLIIPKGDQGTIDSIKAAIEAAKTEYLIKFGGTEPVELKLPLRDGDFDRAEDDNYANSYFISASSITRPGIVDFDVKPILDQEKFYSGCYGRASILLYPYNTKDSCGIACRLLNLQKTSEGEPLGYLSRSEEDFGK